MKRTATAAGKSNRSYRTIAVWGLVLLVTATVVPRGGAAPTKSPGRFNRPFASRAGHPVQKRLIARVLPQPTIAPARRGDAFRYATALGAYRATIGDRSTKSAGVRIEIDGRWLQFTLRGSGGSRVSSDGEEVKFAMHGGTSASYQRLDNGIKENIVLAKRPRSSTIEFAFARQGLLMVQRRNGYHFYGNNRSELFWVKSPVVYDAGGMQGGATLRILGDTAIIQIEKKFLAAAKYPLVVDPTIVATTTQPSGAGLSIDRHIVRSSAGKLVFFYQSGAGLQYKTSTDNGSTWSAATAVSPTTYNEFAVFISATNDIYLTYRSNGVTDSIFFRKLTYAAGNWTIGAEVSVEGTGQERRYPSIVRESGGLIWVTYRYRSNAGAYTIRVRSSNNEGAAWSASTTLATVNNRSSSSAVVYQARGAVVYENNDTSLDWRRYNGAAWNAAQTIVSGSDYDDANWGSLTTTSNGNLHLVYAPQGGGYIRYTYYNGTTWSAPYTLSSAAGDRYPSISTDGTRVWVVWSQYVGPNQYKLVYRKNVSGTWDTGPKLLTGPEENTFDKALVYTGTTGVSYTESLTANEYVGAGTAQNWRADDQSWLYNLPFPFKFYDTTRTTVYVSSNGFLDFVSNSADYQNTTALLRSRVMIAGLFDDIVTNGAAQPGEDIYIYQPDTHSVVFRWVGQTYTGAYPVNFEIRLYDDGRIKFNYGSGNTGLTPTVGVSSGDGTRYTMSTYDGASTLTNVQTSVWQPSASTNWVDRTAGAANTIAGDVPLFSANGDVLYMGMATRFDYVYFDLGTPASASIAPTWQYWDGTAWQTLTLTDNPAYGFTASGRVGFTPPAGWQIRSLNGSDNLYYIRVVRTASAALTPPVANQFTAIRNNVQPTTDSIDTSAVPVGWSEGVASPYSVRFAAVPLWEITLAIEGTYDLDGKFHSLPPYGVDFGDMDPEIGQYTARSGPGLYAVRMRVTSDSTWDISAQASDDLKDGSGNTIPIGNLKWAFDGTNTWSPFVKAPATSPVLIGQGANFPGGNPMDFDYRLNIDWTTTGSSQPYGTTLTYTAIQN